MLSIKNLSHQYPNGPLALNQINLDIPKGMFGLLGPNGAGKSSLMRTLATLQTPTSGHIEFNGTNVLTEPLTVRRQLGYLPQDFGVYPRGSAHDLLEHIAVLKGLHNRQQRKQVVESLLVKTNLFEVRNKAVSTYSGGMRQRFGIAQALIGTPKLIIVDEPTAGLDPEERNRFHNLLAEIGEDIVVILSTHIVEDVANLCPAMAIMANGQIVKQGAPETLIAELCGKVWQKTIEKHQLAYYSKQHRVLSHHLCGGKVALRVASPMPPMGQFEPATPNLEDVYFLATSGDGPIVENTEQSLNDKLALA